MRIQKLGGKTLIFCNVVLEPKRLEDQKSFFLFFFKNLIIYQTIQKTHLGQKPTKIKPKNGELYIKNTTKQTINQWYK